MSFIDIPVVHGRLEAFLWNVDSPKGAVVVCHPHPQHGGTMHNHVTYRIAQAFRDQGVAALRFNFRGVGRSTGTYDEGRGELDDARAALEFMSAQYVGIPLYIAGFSFGARVALQLATSDQRVERVLAVGLALDLFDYSFIKELHKPAAFIQAENDEYGAFSRVEALVAQVPLPRQLFLIPRSDHLCTGRLSEFEQVVSRAVTWLLAVQHESAHRVQRQA